MTEEIKTGVDVLRAVVRARRFKSHLSLLARDLNVPVGDLEDFVDSGRELPMPVLQELAKEFFDAEIDVATGLLRSANRNEATPMPDAATYPPPYSPKTPEQSPWCRKSRRRSRSAPAGWAVFCEQVRSDRGACSGRDRCSPWSRSAHRLRPPA